MYDQSAIIEAARLHVRPLILTRFDPFSCVASARVLIDCFTYFGVRSEAYPVTAFVLNNEARLLADSGAGLEEIYAEAMKFSVSDVGGPWTMGLGHDDGDPQGAGHVVVYLPDHDMFMDISADQINRPQKGIIFEPMVINGCPNEPVALGDDDTGTVIIYYPDPPGRFRKSPNWLGKSRGDRQVFKDVTGAAIRAMKKELSHDRT